MRAGEEKRSKLRKTPYGKVAFKPFSDIECMDYDRLSPKILMISIWK